MQLKSLLPLAASNLLSSATAAKVSTQADADSLAGAVTEGIEISSTYTGDLILPAVTTVVGNITYSGPDLINFSAPVLSVVVGTFNFTGAFKSLSIPVVTQITEALIVETSESSFNCSPFQTLQNDGVVKGDFTCTV
ncbi:hypothetical protein TMatcc_008331 [Talaromyces marneffei ATCC 18224]|uniref:uncharacterized protein n=1 Tax=Talaromyces marneffei TaxID=37727 RepID=UPI0012A7BD09|nr:uncharacterized protein EYB26_007680 [Talaromyces marneffei]KAE8550315.1 hypothetical protein EYB25_006541 [Talaromyces marneffei]QGA19980.1 hypothetical protein EYB26_007680 [Talaromyces marneffei]